MKIKKVLATVSLASLMLANISPINMVSALETENAAKSTERTAAAGSVSVASCLRHLEKNDEGLVVFQWDGQSSKGFGEKYCFWIILDEDKLQRAGFSAGQCEYLKANQLERCTQSSFGKEMGKNAAELRDFFNGRFGLETMESLIRRLRSADTADSDTTDSAATGSDVDVSRICDALDRVVSEARSTAEPVSLPTDEPSASVAAEPLVAAAAERPTGEFNMEGSNSYISLVSRLGGAPLPAELEIGGVVVYYYDGVTKGTRWMGYLITHPSFFAKWCDRNGISEAQRKILVACQNTWIADVSSLSGDDCIRNMFPKKFVDALFSVKQKAESGGNMDAQTYVSYTSGSGLGNIWCGATIYSDAKTSSCVDGQFGMFKVSDDSKKDILHSWSAVFNRFLWKNPASWRIEVLKKNGDI